MALADLGVEGEILKEKKEFDFPERCDPFWKGPLAALTAFMQAGEVTMVELRAWAGRALKPWLPFGCHPPTLLQEVLSLADLEGLIARRQGAEGKKLWYLTSELNGFNDAHDQEGSKTTMGDLTTGNGAEKNLTTLEAAHLLGCSDTTFRRRAMAAGIAPASQDGERQAAYWRYEDVLRVRAAQEEAEARPAPKAVKPAQKRAAAPKAAKPAKAPKDADVVSIDRAARATGGDSDATVRKVRLICSCVAEEIMSVEDALVTISQVVGSSHAAAA